MEHGQTGRKVACASTRDVATDDGAHRRRRERQVNDALCTLDEMHRLGRIERDDYRWRRRRLLESLGEATVSIAGTKSDACTECSEQSERTERDTVRRAVPAGELPAAYATVRRYGNGEADGRATQRRRSGARRVLMCALLLGLVAGVAAICWFMAAA